MYSIGYDVGSSSVKVALLDIETGETVASAYSPKQEMPIAAPRPGWAEQDPEMWWKNLVIATREIFSKVSVERTAIRSIGISYQMHGLVLVDKNGSVLRPSVIWCDSRAVDIGRKAFKRIGKKRCLETVLNSPGNFTASKLRWVRENEPTLFDKVDKFMLPGDYIALRMTGERTTTVSGLSEGILWDFKKDALAKVLLDEYEIDENLISTIVPTFGDQGHLLESPAKELGLPSGIQVSYRAGDQPNNAFSLNVLEPGEIAATAGTSGVVYGVSATAKYDPASRVNSFVHVNHTKKSKRVGVLLCINGTGISMSWLRRMVGKTSLGYAELNAQAAEIPAGSEGMLVVPFGNGAERMLEDADVGAHVLNINYNTHSDAHLVRAVQEGVACSFRYGMDIMKTMKVKPTVMRAGHANMFLSPVFRQALANIANVTIELYNTDGAQGAARGAAVGAGLYSSIKDAFGGLAKTDVVEPEIAQRSLHEDLYETWLNVLKGILRQRSY
jgi:xylulokinase